MSDDDVINTTVVTISSEEVESYVANTDKGSDAHRPIKLVNRN